MSSTNFCVLGVDLAGVDHRPTGICVLRGSEAITFLLHTDEEIIGCGKSENPDLIAMDAPLTLPPGRKTIHDRNGSHFRICDEELRRRKIPFFPITLGPMRLLTERGMRLAHKLEGLGFRCVEIYPGGAQDVLGIPRAKKNLSGLREALIQLGFAGLASKATPHELDAVTGALVGRLFLQGKAEIYGKPSVGAIIMPAAK
jgi:predicted nuclease with RNAse H fold